MDRGDWVHGASVVHVSLVAYDTHTGAKEGFMGDRETESCDTLICHSTC